MYILISLSLTFCRKRRVVSFFTSEGERVASYKTLLRNTRSILRSDPAMIISDGSRALRKATDAIYPGIPFQYCLNHKLNLVRKHIKPELKPYFLSMYRMFSNSPTIMTSLCYFNNLRSFLIHHAPEAYPHLISNSDYLFTYHTQPSILHKQLKTNNLIESVNSQIRFSLNHAIYLQKSSSLKRGIFCLIKKINYSLQA